MRKLAPPLTCHEVRWHGCGVDCFYSLTLTTRGCQVASVKKTDMKGQEDVRVWLHDVKLAKNK